MVLFDNLIIKPIGYFAPRKEFWKSTCGFMVGVFLFYLLLQMPFVPQACGFVLHVGKIE